MPRWLFTFLAALLIAGCEEKVSEPTPEVPSGPAVTIQDPPGDYEPAALRLDWEEVQLVPVTYEQWERELAAFGGSIVVVDYWATWCVPCRERFPKMVAMAERFGPRDVAFLSLSLDDRDDPLTIDDVTAFLESQNARMPNYLMDEIIPDAFEKLDLLGIPAVSVYGRDGELRVRLTGDDPNRQFTEQDVEEAVLMLLDDQS